MNAEAIRPSPKVAAAGEISPLSRAFQTTRPFPCLRHTPHAAAFPKAAVVFFAYSKSIRHQAIIVNTNPKAINTTQEVNTAETSGLGAARSCE